MFTLAHARDIYAFFTPDGRRRDLTTEKVGSLLRQQLDLPLFRDIPLDVDLDNVDSPNRIPADRAQEAIIYVLEKIFGLKAAEGKLGNFEKVYKIFTSKGKGPYYQSLFRITISHTFFKIEQKSKRPNLSKSKADCVKKYQAYWVPIRIAQNLKGEWLLSEPYVPDMFVDKTTGTTVVTKGCPVVIIDDEKQKKEWENSTEIGKMSLITLSYSLKNACAEVIRFSGKDADTIFKSSNFCSFFYFLKRIIDEATESVILPYLTPVHKTDLPLKISGSSADKLEDYGYRLVGAPQIFMPKKMLGLFAAQHPEADLIKRLASQPWDDQSDMDLKALLKAYENAKLPVNFNKSAALTHPIIQLLIPTTIIEITYEDIVNNKDIEVLWKYGEINESILAIGSPFHRVYDMYPDISYPEYIENQTTATALSKDISRLSLKDSRVSFVFIHVINQVTLKEFYILNSIYLDAELVNDTIGPFEHYLEDEATDDGEMTEVPVTKTSYTSSAELNSWVCSSLKLLFNITTDFGRLYHPEIYISDLITSNVPKSRALSILFDCLNKLSYRVVLPDSDADNGLLLIVPTDRET